MKRIVSIFLLLIMLVVGAHPVLAMHFCGGELYSFDVLNNDIKKSCCEDVENMPQEENNSCCASENEDMPQAQHVDMLQSHDDCCNIQQVQISTDDYRHHTQQFNLNNILPSFENVWLALYLLVPVDNDSTTKNNQLSPPDGLSFQNSDLLTYICIYRI